MTLVATQVKRRRGTNDENDVFAGAEGEITVDLTNKELRVHSGNNKFGGYRIGRLTDRQMGIESIPQTIFFEITSNGGLKLLAGSKVIIPNGSGVYNTREITSDISVGQQLYNNDNMPIVFAEGYGIVSCVGEDSGATTPTASSSYKVFYNTTENKCYFDNGAWRQCSLPFARASRNSTVGFYRIDRIYNGYGYVGNTWFLLNNLGLLLPNGQNKDGTFKNILRYTTAVKRTSRTWTSSINQVLYTDGDSLFGILNDYVESETMPTNNTYTLWYKPSEHIMRMNSTSTTYTKESDWLVANVIPLVYLATGQAVKPLKMKNIFTPLDKNDTEYIAHQAMPSGSYIDLTLGASGSIYTAPADGYFILLKKGDFQQYITIDSGYDKVYADYAYNDQVVGLRISVKKGQNVAVWYSASKATQRFAFMYAQGSK